MNYNQKDHSHCPSKNSPCGIQGEHRCYLCLKPVKDDWKEEFVKWFYEEPAMELANGVGTPENIAEWWINKLAEQKKELLQ